MSSRALKNTAMPINSDTLKNWHIPESVDSYDERDCILYALSIGYGCDPLDTTLSLPFVFERGLRVVPSLLTVVGAPGSWLADPRTGVDSTQVLHGEHRMTVHMPLPTGGILHSKTRVARIVDKGLGRGALIVTERTITEHQTGLLVATIEHTSFCRADGGIDSTDTPPPALKPTPEKPPDSSIRMTTISAAALLYRLNGDRNPIHADPAVARTAGFGKPILHGLCTYGMACRAILQLCCDNDPSLLSNLSTRFSAPFYPGNTLRVDIWKSGLSIQFQGICESTGARVLTHGNATLRKEPLSAQREST